MADRDAPPSIQKAVQLPAGLADVAGILTTHVHAPIVNNDGQHRLRLTHRLTTGPMPSVSLAWQPDPHWVAEGYMVHGFVSRRPFRDPKVSQIEYHGDRVVSSKGGGTRVVPLRSGEHNFTFLLVLDRPLRLLEHVGQNFGLHGPAAVAASVQFSVHVPGGDDLAGRIGEATRVKRAMLDDVRVTRELQKELGLLPEPDPVEAHAAKVQGELDKEQAERDTVIRHFERLMAAVDTNTALTKAQRSAEIKRLRNRLDAQLRRRRVY